MAEIMEMNPNTFIMAEKNKNHGDEPKYLYYGGKHGDVPKCLNYDRNHGDEPKYLHCGRKHGDTRKYLNYVKASPKAAWIQLNSFWKWFKYTNGISPQLFPLIG